MRALFLRYHHPERDAFPGIEDSELVRYCFLTSTTTTQPAPASAAELALQDRQLQLADFQLTELRRQSELQTQFAGQIDPLLALLAEDAQGALDERERLAPIQQELLDLALEDLRRGGAASPEQLALIEEASAAGIEAGEVDIERFRTESLEALREELAPGLGLRPSDSPILDRGAKVAAEATRQGGQLASGFRAAEASAKLSLPLASSQLLQSTALGLSNLTEATSQFQDQLRSSAISNRIGLFESVGGLGLGLSTRVNIGGFPGFQRGSTTTSGGLGQLLGPSIGALGAIGAGFAASSSRDFKEDIRVIPEGEALKAVETLDLATWRYKPEMGLGLERHAGPMAEDMKGLGLSDGRSVHPMDSAGLGLAAVKDLAKKVERLEHSLGLAEAA